MYNAAHMGAMAIGKAGKVDTGSIREALKGIKFNKAPQGTVEMRALDHQAVLPSYLMKVREGWSSVNDMFEQVQTVARAVPQDARCNLPL